MSKKRNLIFLSLLILGVLLLTSCFLNPPVTEGILKGQVLVPEGTLEAKDLTGQVLPDATVNIIDLATGNIITTTTTDTNGTYQVSVPPGGPYLLEAVKDGVKLEQITCSVEVGIEYDLGTADCTTTAAALIAQAMLNAEDYPNNPADIDCAAIIADPNFNDVSSIVCSTIESGNDPTASAAIGQAVEDFLYPSTPEPSPSPTPTYNITFDKNDADATGTMTDQTIASGSSANLTTCAFSKTDWTFAGWAETSDGDVAYTDEESYIMGTANVTLYAKWTINTYAVTFHSHDGTAVDSQTVDHGGLVTEPASPTPAKEGYIFAGWYKESGYINTWVFDTDTVTSNITLHAKWTCTTSYSIGDVGPAGGWIFYDNGYYDDIWKGQYLEAAFANQTDREWGKSEDVLGADGTVIGTGQQNTSDIVAQDNTNVTAADECANYSTLIGGVTYDDWFLPSKDELNEMYVNLHLEGVGDFPVDMAYWSSSEYADNKACTQKFEGGAQLHPYKYWSAHVRPVRAF